MIDMSVLLTANGDPDFQAKFKKLMKYDNGTWKNLQSIKDPDKLRQFEYHETKKRSIALIKQGPKITSTNDLTKIHKMLFANVYPWAGQFRVYDIAKGNTAFLPAINFPEGTNAIEQELAICNKKAKLDPKDYANLLDKINFLHPFPEGNGRSTKTFLQCFAKNHGQQLNYDRHQDTMINYLNAADIDGIAQQLHVTDLGKAPVHKTIKQADNGLEL